MGRDDEIDDQVHADWEFTRRAEQLMNKLRTQGKTGPSAGDVTHDEPQPSDREEHQSNDSRPKPK